MLFKALKWTGKKAKSFRFTVAILLALLAFVVAIGAVEAGGPMRPPHPPGKGMWGMHGMYWGPVLPVPKVEITAVVKNEMVTFTTADFPEDMDFVVTTGYMYTRGVDGYVVGESNSGDGESQELTFEIPSELEDQYRISIRAQTDDDLPYYSFNWFYNNSTKEAETNS